MNTPGPQPTPEQYRAELERLAASVQDHGTECGSCMLERITRRYAKHLLHRKQGAAVTQHDYAWVMEQATIKWKRRKHWLLYQECLAKGMSHKAIEEEFKMKGWLI